MSYRLKIGLVVFGLIVLLVSLVALGYAYWPLVMARDQVLVAPTLLAPP